MSLAPPKLEDRTFEQILAEARLQIARYTPELSLGWTDHNESDPGIVLVQLFAWLSQITQERVNKLPARAYQSLLHLLGLDVQPATSAAADLVFEAIPGKARGTTVPVGTQVGAPPDANGNPVVFQTVEPLDLISAELAHVLVYDGSVFTEITKQNEPDAGTIQPFGDRPQENAAIYFGFAVPQQSETGWRPFPKRILLRAFEPALVPDFGPVTCAGTPSLPRARMQWEYLPGPSQPWKPLTIYEDTTRALEIGGYLVLEGPTEIAPAPLWTLIDPPNFWLRLRLIKPDYGSRVPGVAFFRFNTVRARHEVTQTDVSLGISTGAPDQTIRLPGSPVVPNTLVLEVVEPGNAGRSIWTRVEMFRKADPRSPDDASGPDARVYRLDGGTGEVQFGDGTRAAIPTPGAEIIARSFRFGGGTAGNVAAGQISSLLATIDGAGQVENPRPAVGGKNAQPVEEALRDAPQWLRRGGRAVTAPDFEDAARRVGGVSRAKALPNTHPSYPGVVVPGAVTVLIVQDTDRKPPRPGEDLLRIVCGELDRQRTLTTEVYVRGPSFVPIDVEIKIEVDPTRSISAAEDRARQVIEAYLSPKGWRFGAYLYPANLQSQLLALPEEIGIRAVTSLRITAGGRPHDDPIKPIEFARDALPYPATITVRGTPQEES